jgi:hypothetical protein
VAEAVGFAVLEQSFSAEASRPQGAVSTLVLCFDDSLTRLGCRKKTQTNSLLYQLANDTIHEIHEMTLMKFVLIRVVRGYAFQATTSLRELQTEPVSDNTKGYQREKCA